MTGDPRSPPIDEKLFAGETIVALEVKEAALAWVPEAMRFRVIAASETEDEQPPVEGDSNAEVEDVGDALGTTEAAAKMRAALPPRTRRTVSHADMCAS